MVEQAEIWRRRGVRSAVMGSCAILALVGLAEFAVAADGPSGSTDRTASAQPASPVPERHFDINAYDVVGNTVLDEKTIDAVLEPFLGPDRPMSDIEAARGALEKAYAARGFQTVYVTIPKQTVKGGIVKLEAVETKIGAVSIKGERYASKKQIGDALPSLLPGAVPNLKNLNSELVTLNSTTQDTQVTPQMKQGATPGTIDVDLDVKDKLPLHGGVEINNRYSRDTHQYRLQANASYDDLWHLGHSVSALYSVTPEDPADGEVYALTYGAPVPGSDVKLSLTGLRSNSNIATLGSTNVLGKGWSATLNATVPLGSASLFGDGDYFHYLQFSGAYKRFDDTVSLCSSAITSGSCTGKSLQVSRAPITYYPVSVGYVGSLRDALDQVSVNASLTFSFRGLGSDQTAFGTSRYGADANFVYVRGGASWLRTLPYDLQVYTSFTGQYANGALISNEQFSLGGDGSVRGYLQSEGLGDDGAQGMIEFRSPNLGLYVGNFVNDWRIVGFFDAGATWLHDALPGQQKSYALYSTGVGTTLQLFANVNGSLFWTYPLRDDSARHGLSGLTDYGQSRLQFRVWTQF